MGGNARFIDRQTGKDKGFAEKIDLNKISRDTIVNEVLTGLLFLNQKIHEKKGNYLWPDREVIKKGYIFNGSSFSLFDRSISNEHFVKFKPLIGDIDVTFPREHMKNLWGVLNELENTEFSKYITYMGHKNSAIEPNKAGNLNQINAVFRFDNDDISTFIQIDFEASEYQNSMPTEWSMFSHNSDWEDIKNGYKGVMHKFTLMNLARASSKMNDIKVVTPTQVKKIEDVSSIEYEEFVKQGKKNKLAKVSTKKDFINPTNLAFSVDKGVRIKFRQLFHNDGIPAKIDGSSVFVFVAPNESNYETKLESIFSLIFHTEPKDDDLKEFKSFVGLVNLMKKYLDQSIIEDFFINHLIPKSLFGENAQGLERNNPDEDKKIKMMMVDKLYSSFNYLTKYKDKVEHLKNKYYAAYKMYDEIEGKFINKSFSQIFESIDREEKLV